MFLFGVVPYLAVALAVGGTVYRYRALRSTVTARSSQLLEGRMLFWGSVPWHHAILVILVAHLVAAVFRDVGPTAGLAARLFVSR